MPNDYANKANISGTEYDLHDARVPEATASDADKVLKVNAQGAYELGQAGGGGGASLYLHEITIADDSAPTIKIIAKRSEPFTISDLVKINPSDMARNYGIISLFGNNTSGNCCTYTFIYDGTGPGYNYASLGYVIFRNVNNSVSLSGGEVFTSETVMTDTVTAL